MSTLVSDLLSYVETKTQAGTGTLNNSTGLGYLNEALLDFRSEMIKRGIDASQIQEAYTSVTLPSVGGSTFAYPSDMFRLKTIEVNMIDTTQQNYLQAEQVDVSNTPSQVSFDWMRVEQPTNFPLFDDRGDTFEIFPTFTSTMNLTNAIHIFYFLTPVPYSATSATLTYPDSLNWYILAQKVASIYYEALSKFDDAKVWSDKYLAALARLDTTLEQGSQQPLQATAIQLTGWEF